MKQVLIISKEPVFVPKNPDLLLRAKLNIIEVADVHKAHQMLDRETYEFIIIDDRLLDLGIYKVCQTLRKTNNSRIVLLGSKPDTEVNGNLDELGIDLYVERPVNTHDLLKKLTESIDIEGLEAKIDTEQLELEKAKLEEEDVESERPWLVQSDERHLEEEQQRQLRLERERLATQADEQIVQEKGRLEKEIIEHVRLERELLEKQAQEQILLEKSRLEKEIREQYRLEVELLEKHAREQIAIGKEHLKKLKMEREWLEEEIQQHINKEYAKLEQLRFEEGEK